MDEERREFTFLGRVIGTGTDWEGELGQVWGIYDFQPVPGSCLNYCVCFVIDEIGGNFEEYEGGYTIKTWDIIEVLATLPKAAPKAEE